MKIQYLHGRFFHNSAPTMSLLNTLIASILFLTFIFIFIATFTAIAQTDDEPVEEKEKPTIDDLKDDLKKNRVIQVTGVIGIASLIFYIPVAIRERHIKDVEDALPDVLMEIAENIRSGRSVESAFKEVADVRTDRIGRELKRASQEMLYTSFEAAMRAFSQRTGSRALIRVVSLVLIAVESGASLATVLEKIANELWEVYILKEDREAKSSTNASVILWGGAAFTPGIIGFILGVFNSNAQVTLNLDAYIPVFTYFLMCLGLVSIIMRGVAMGTLKQDLMRAPFFFWLPGMIYLVVQGMAGSFM